MQNPDDNGAGRSKSTGRFLKNASGNRKGRPPKPPVDTLPYELAREVLEAGALLIDIKDRDGKSKKVPAVRVILKQLAFAAAKGDKSAARLFINYQTAAAQTVDAHKRRHYDRLGAYLHALDEGKAWPLDDAEAEYYQELADSVGMKVQIRPRQKAGPVQQLTNEDVDPIVKNAGIWNALGSWAGHLDERARTEIVARVIYAWTARSKG